MNFRSDIYLALFLLLSVRGGFKCFWMGYFHKNIQLILELLKAPFLVLQFSYYILMTFLKLLSVILPSVLIILLLTGIWPVTTTRIGFWTWVWSKRHCGLDRKWIVDFIAGKTQLASFDWSNNTCYWCENGWVCSWGKIIF